LKLHDQIMAALETIDATNEQKRDAEEGWRKGIAVIYHRILREQIIQAVKQKSPADIGIADQCGREFGALLDFNNLEAPRPHEVERVCMGRDALTPEVRG
jgi:hypothetical protein